MVHRPSHGSTFTTSPVGTDVSFSGISGVSTLALPALGFTIESKDDKWTGSIQSVATWTVVEADSTVTAIWSKAR